MKTRPYSYGRQVIEQDDIDAVSNVLRSDWLTQGPNIERFEKALCGTLGARYVSAISNGTAALHLIALALGWKPGDIVITSPITFVASANCALYVGATADFVDIDPVSYTIDTLQLEKRIREYGRKGQRIKAVVAVDYAGHPCDWRFLRTLADRYEFQLVSDNCHALGAEYEYDKSYAVRYADVVALSFHPVKHITTGEGGAVVTNNAAIDARIKLLRAHGMTKNPDLLEKNDGPWYYEMQELGWNYRITDFQCAMGCTQLTKLDRFLNSRRTIAAFYDHQLGSDERFLIPRVREGVRHAYHIYPLRIRFSTLKVTKREVFEKLNENGIFPQVHYVPVHLQPYYQKRFGFRSGDFPTAEAFYTEELSIPLYPGLTREDLSFICRSLVGAIS